MSIHQLPTFATQPASALARRQGEVAMPHAPSVTLPNGATGIPQHYLQYRQSVESISGLLQRVECGHDTLLFAGSDHSGMYVQVGMIGRENFDRAAAVRPQKLVYGRKWRIDTDTPSSEIIQTIFLAIKKAREHEVREYLTLTDPVSGKTGTPLSTHLDLALMATHGDFGQACAPAAQANAAYIAQLLAPVRFGQRQAEVIDAQQRPNGDTMVDLRWGAAPLARQREGDMAEFDHLQFSLILPTCTQSALVYELMEAMIRHSDRWVDEHFLFDGFARFSRHNDPLRLARFSVASRPYARDMTNTQFAASFAQLNYQVDASRAPSLGAGALAAKNRRRLDACGSLAGHMPKGYTQLHSQRHLG